MYYAETGFSQCKDYVVSSKPICDVKASKHRDQKQLLVTAVEESDALAKSMVENVLSETERRSETERSQPQRLFHVQIAFRLSVKQELTSRVRHVTFALPRDSSFHNLCAVTLDEHLRA